MVIARSIHWFGLAVSIDSPSSMRVSFHMLSLRIVGELCNMCLHQGTMLVSVPPREPWSTTEVQQLVRTYRNSLPRLHVSLRGVPDQVGIHRGRSTHCMPSYHTVVCRAECVADRIHFQCSISVDVLRVHQYSYIGALTALSQNTYSRMGKSSASAKS